RRAGTIIPGVRRSRRPPGHAGDGSLPRLMTPSELLGEPGAAVDEEALRKAEEFIEQEEGAARHFTGWTDRAITTIAVAMSLFHLYAAQAIIPAQILRAIHVAFVLDRKSTRLNSSHV